MVISQNISAIIFVKQLSNMKTILLPVILLILFLRASQTLSSPQQITPSYKYSFSATQVFSTASYYGTGNNVVNSLLYTIIFPKAMNDSNYKSGIGIQQIYAQITNRRFNITFLLNVKNPANVKFKMWSNTMDKLRTMTIRYLIIDSSWGVFSFAWLMKPIYTFVSSSTSYNYTMADTGTNTTGTINSYSSLTGFDVAAASATNELSLVHSITKTLDTLFGQLTSLSSTPVDVWYISFNILSYNVGEMNVLPGKITIGSFDATNAAALRFVDNFSKLRQYNCLFGLKGFYIINEAFLSWNGTVATNSSITVTSDNNFQYFKFTYIILEEYWCQEATIYLLIATSTCYDICPNGYYANDVGLTCEPCLYDCFQCTNASVCSACDNSTDFRVMNTSTSRCLPLPGYYDDGLSHIVALACNANCLTCTTSSTYCLSCPPGKFLSGTTCVGCVDPNCNNCTTSSNCWACVVPYSPSANVCVLNCTLVNGNCTSCSSTPTLACTACATGFFLNTTDNTCAVICGDGILASTELCDDGNKVDGDGCSSVCAIETAYFCTGAVGSRSNCSGCSPNCLNCTSFISCSLCQTIYLLNVTSLTCEPNCSVVTLCATCSVISNAVACNTCVSGYAVGSSNTCVPKCGDGIVISGSQQCDDNNLVNGDGCSDACMVEPAFWCSGSPSICSPCMQFCTACTSASTCSSCNSLTTWTASPPSCTTNCATITYCIICTLSYLANADYIQCLSCSAGYSLGYSTNTCLPICGNGVLAPEEQCDDGNLNAGDGCDGSCKAQQYYTCNPSTVTAGSQCFLSSLNLSLIDITKSSSQNTGVMNFQPSPAHLPLFNTINWTAVISTQNSNVIVTSASYNSAKNRVTVDFSYSNSIQASLVLFSINTTEVAQLSAVPPFSVAVKAQADDNQALEYYSQSDYSMAKIVKFLALAAGACAVLFLVLGILGGRLVALECSGIIQLAFVSTLTLQNLSPAFSNLNSLSLSLGYNRLKPYEYSQSIDRHFKFAQLGIGYLNNYNAMGALILIPILLAIICKLISKKSKDQQRKIYWNKKAKHCIGQFTLYALLSFSYLAFLSLFIEVKYMNTTPTIDYMGIGIGSIVILVALSYLFFYAKADSFYTEFKQKFEPDGFSSRFYIFPILQRITVPAMLVQMVNKSYGNAPIMAIYVLLGVLLLIKKPYKGYNQNIRPFVNYLIVIIIQGVYLGVKFMNSPKGFLSLYGPFVVLGLLFICIGYSGYALVKDLKQYFSQCRKQQIRSENIQMNQLASKMLNQQFKKVFDQQTLDPINTTNVRKESNSLMIDIESPGRLNLSNVKQQLSKLENIKDISPKEAEHCQLDKIQQIQQAL